MAIRPRTPVLRAARWVATSALALTAAEASAALSLPKQNPTVDRDARTGDLNYIVSRQDCLDDVDFTFDFAFTNYTGVLAFEVWISEGGADCKVYTNRVGATARCYQINPKSGGVVPTTTSGSVVLGSDSIANAIPDVVECTDESGAAERATTLFFLFIRATGADVAADDTYQWTKTKVDLVGPQPPTNLEASGADNVVSVSYTALANQTGVLGFAPFCSVVGTAPPAGGSGGTGGSAGSAGGGSGGAAGGGSGGAGSGGAGGAGAGGAGAGGDGGSTGAGGTSGDCTSSTLVEGEIPPVEALCGEITGENSPAVTAETLGGASLENGTTYVVGVAAVDDVGNYGPLSELVCTAPVELTDFFDGYKEAGGVGGGCACSVGGGDRLAGLTSLATCAAALLWRRRKRKAV